MKVSESFSVEQRFMNLEQTAAYLGIGLTNTRKFVKGMGKRLAYEVRYFPKGI